MVRLGKERAMNMTVAGNGFHEQVVMNSAGGAAIGELPGVERVVTSGGEETSIIEGVEDDLESDASSR